ncbi:MAG: OmpH family outer membrane protein [Rhodocyclaceae bacterium]|nr:OmpH family outer membrane protein [Rhodocyclaceae bacterium]
MKNAMRILAPVVLALAMSPALAEMKLGFVNGQRVVNESPQAKKAKQKIEKEFERRDQELQQLSKRLQTMQADLEKNSVTMAESERRNKEREFNDLNREFQRKQREFREDLNLRQNEEMAAIFERANKIIKQIAETEKFDLIVQEAVYFSPRIDITEKVIKALGDGK